MKKTLSLLICLVLLMMAVSAFADDNVKITVTGSGSISVEPDQMQVTANITSISRELSVAQETVSTAVNDIHTALNEIGIQESDIITTSYNCSTMYNYNETPYELIGYQTSHTLTVTCRDLTLVDAVLEALVKNGKTEIYGISFDVSNRKTLYLKALALALDAAREKAEILVGAASLQKYSISNITEENTYGFSNYYAEKAAVDTGAGIGIHTGDISIEAYISVEYEAR